MRLSCLLNPTLMNSMHDFSKEQRRFTDVKKLPKTVLYTFQFMKTINQNKIIWIYFWFLAWYCCLGCSHASKFPTFLTQISDNCDTFSKNYTPVSSSPLILLDERRSNSASTLSPGTGDVSLCHIRHKLPLLVMILNHYYSRFSNKTNSFDTNPLYTST